MNGVMHHAIDKKKQENNFELFEQLNASPETIKLVRYAPEGIIIKRLPPDTDSPLSWYKDNELHHAWL